MRTGPGEDLSMFVCSLLRLCYSIIPRAAKNVYAVFYLQEEHKTCTVAQPLLPPFPDHNSQEDRTRGTIRIGKKGSNHAMRLSICSQLFIIKLLTLIHTAISFMLREALSVPVFHCGGTGARLRMTLKREGMP
jgi:hypothetical protein